MLAVVVFGTIWYILDNVWLLLRSRPSQNDLLDVRTVSQTLRANTMVFFNEYCVCGRIVFLNHMWE